MRGESSSCERCSLHPALCTGDLTFMLPAAAGSGAETSAHHWWPILQNSASRLSLGPAGRTKGLLQAQPTDTPFEAIPHTANASPWAFLLPGPRHPFPGWAPSLRLPDSWHLALADQGNSAAQTVVSHAPGRGPHLGKGGEKQADAVKPRPRPMPSLPLSPALSSTPSSQATFLESSPLPDLPQPTTDPHHALP